jgi:ABC-2 type transport system permease protein
MKWVRVKAIVQRHWYVLLRAPQRWFDVVVWPVVDALLFGSIGLYFSEQSGAGEKATGFLLAGIILFHVLFQAEISLSTGFMEETWSSNLLNLLTTPLREVEYGAGVMLFGLAKLAMGVGTVSLVALALFAFDITGLGFALIPLMAILLVVGWSIALFVIGLILRVGQGAEILAWGFIALIMPLSGIFYPVSALPGLLQPIAQALPTTHLFEAARGVLAGEGLSWGEVGIATAEGVVVVAGALWFLVTMLAVFRRRGYISRHV